MYLGNWHCEIIGYENSFFDQLKKNSQKQQDVSCPLKMLIVVLSMFMRMAEVMGYDSGPVLPGILWGPLVGLVSLALF